MLMIVNKRSIAIVMICMLLTTGCATFTTTSHFTKESPRIYSGTRLDIHASAHHEDALLVYRDKYGVTPPEYPILDLPFSLLLDSIIFLPIVSHMFAIRLLTD